MASRGKSTPCIAVLTAITVCFILTGLPAAAQTDLRFDAYHDHAFINQWMQELSRESPETFRYEELGLSRGGRSIAMLVVTGPSGRAPGVYFNGAHHGNEKVSAEAVLGLIDWFRQNPDDDRARSILEHWTLYLQPVVNPDGHVSGSRFDLTGIDPNRDYGVPGRADIPAFRAPETRLVAGVLARHPIYAAAAIHSGMEAVLWPYCYTRKPNPLSAVFRHLSVKTAAAMDINWVTQSSHDYYSTGEFIDYAFIKHGVLALTLEISLDNQPRPDRLPVVVDRSVRGALAFIEGLTTLPEHLVSTREALPGADIISTVRSKVKSTRIH